MRLDEMRNYVRSVVDIDSTDISDDTLNRMIGEGYDLVVYSKKRWPFYEVETTFSTVASTKDYSLATVGASISVPHDGSSHTPGMREIASVRTDDHVVQYIGRDDGDVVNPLDVTTTGEPLEWAFWGETLRFYPVPDAVYTVTVRGFRNAVAFGAGSSATATPDLPTPFHQTLATYALARAYQQQEDIQMANHYFAVFQQEIDNLSARYDDAPAPQPIILNARSNSRWRAEVLPARLRYSWE